MPNQDNEQSLFDWFMCAMALNGSERIEILDPVYRFFMFLCIADSEGPRGPWYVGEVRPAVG